MNNSRRWLQSKCPPTGERIKKHCVYPHSERQLCVGQPLEILNSDLISVFANIP